MARRVALTLAYLGGVLFLLAGAWAVLGFEFICFGGCVPSEVPDRFLRLLPYYVRFLAPGIVAMLIAWIVCLVLLRCAQWQRWFRTVFAVPLLICLTSVLGIIGSWSIFAQTSADYRTVAEGTYPIFFMTVVVSILLTLVSNLIVIIASHALRHAQS